MKKSTLTHTLCLLSLLALASCKNFNDIVTDLSSPFVTEAPYHKPNTRTAQNVPASNPYISPPPSQSRTGLAPTVPNEIAHNTPKPSTPKITKPKVAEPKKPTPPKQEKIDLRDNSLANKDKETAPKPPTPTPPTPPAQPEVKENPVLTVRPVPGKPTHVYHPIDPNVTIRIADKAGNIPASGTVMRVPNTDIRFVVP